MKAILSFLLVTVFSSVGSEYRVITPALINELAEVMRTNHPALRAEGLKVEAARENARAVRTWEDPMVMLGGMGARDMMRADDGDLLYGVEQKLPLWGKPTQERKVARAEEAMFEQEKEARFQELRRSLAQELFQAALADEKLRLLQEDLRWLETSYALAQEQFAAGDLKQVDLLRLQTEMETKRTGLGTQKELAKQARADVQRALANPNFAFAEAFALPELAGPLEDRNRISAIALRFEPKLRVLEREHAAALEQAELTRRKRFPEVALGAEARNYSGDGSFRQAMVTLSFNIPLGNRSKYQAEYKRDLAKAAAIEADMADMKLEVTREIHQLLIEIAAARREALLYGDIVIPQTQRTLETLTASWEVNSAGIADLIETRRMFLEAKLMRAAAVAEQYNKISALVLCCGIADLEALEMLIKEPK